MRVLAKFSLEKNLPSPKVAEGAFQETQATISEWLRRIGDETPEALGHSTFNRRIRKRGSGRRRIIKGASRTIEQLLQNADGEVREWIVTEPYVEDDERVDDTQFRTELTVGYGRGWVAVHCVAGVEHEQSVVRYLEPQLRVPPVVSDIIKLGNWRVGDDEVVPEPAFFEGKDAAKTLAQRIKSRRRTLPLIIVGGWSHGARVEAVLREEARILSLQIAGLGSVALIDAVTFTAFSPDTQNGDDMSSGVVQIHWPAIGARQATPGNWKLSDKLDADSDPEAAQRAMVAIRRAVQSAIYRQSRSLPLPENLATVRAPFGTSTETDIAQFGAQLSQLAQRWAGLQEEITSLEDQIQDQARELGDLRGSEQRLRTDLGAWRTRGERAEKTEQRLRAQHKTLKRNQQTEKQDFEQRESAFATQLADAKQGATRLRQTIGKMGDLIDQVEVAYRENSGTVSKELERSFGAIRKLREDLAAEQSPVVHALDDSSPTTVEDAVKKAREDATSLKWGQEAEKYVKDLHTDAGPPSAVYEGLIALDALAETMLAGQAKQGIERFMKERGEDASNESRATRNTDSLARKRDFYDDQGEVQRMTWHLKIGYGERDKRAPRVHFCWRPLTPGPLGEKRHQLVVGYIGPHLLTDSA